jgi:hypothetical protein
MRHIVSHKQQSLLSVQDLCYFRNTANSEQFDSSRPLVL